MKQIYNWFKLSTATALLDELKRTDIRCTLITSPLSEDDIRAGDLLDAEIWWWPGYPRGGLPVTISNSDPPGAFNAVEIANESDEEWRIPNGSFIVIYAIRDMRQLPLLQQSIGKSITIQPGSSLVIHPILVIGEC